MVYSDSKTQASSMTPYAPLWCKSNFSFLEGASHPEELVEEARRAGPRARWRSPTATASTASCAAHVEGARARRAADRRRRGHRSTTARRSCSSRTTARATRTSAGCSRVGRLRSEKGESRVELARGVRARRGPPRAVGRRAQPARRRGRAGRRRARAARRVRRSPVRAGRAPPPRRRSVRAERAPARSAPRGSGCPLVAAPEVLYHTPARRAAAGRAHLHPPRRHARDAGPLLRPTPSTPEAAARVRPRCSPTIRPRSRARSRSPRAARSRSASSATAIPPSGCPTARPSSQWLRELDASKARASATAATIPADVARAARQASSRSSTSSTTAATS